MNRLAITRIHLNGRTHIAYIMLDEHREFVDFQLFEAENRTILNNIYVARVEDIVWGIQAAFVRISKEQKCYLPLGEAKDAIFTKKQSVKKELCCGDEILVQVVRDAVKTKDPVVSTHLTLQGGVSVLTSANSSLSVSKKLTKEQRMHYSDLLAECVQEHSPYGVIVRTDAANYEDAYVRQDICDLCHIFETMKETAIHKTLYSLLYQDPPGYISRLKSTNLDLIDGIYTDQEDIFAEISKYPIYQQRSFFYQDPVISLSTLYHISGSIDRLIGKVIWLKSGANIIIEQLETLTVIDVNTAKNPTKDPDTILKVNCEAAKEVARQLKLRNISGMIIIDFINMSSEEQQKELIAVLKKCIALDSVPCSFVDITKLGLVELTRKKVHKSLKELV